MNFFRENSRKKATKFGSTNRKKPRFKASGFESLVLRARNWTNALLHRKRDSSPEGRNSDHNRPKAGKLRLWRKIFEHWQIFAKNFAKNSPSAIFVNCRLWRHSPKKLHFFRNFLQLKVQLIALF